MGWNSAGCWCCSFEGGSCRRKTSWWQRRSSLTAMLSLWELITSLWELMTSWPKIRALTKFISLWTSNKDFLFQFRGKREILGFKSSLCATHPSGLWFGNRARWIMVGLACILYYPDPIRHAPRLRSVFVHWYRTLFLETSKHHAHKLFIVHISLNKLN